MGTQQKNKKHKTVYVDWIGVYAAWTLPPITYVPKLTFYQKGTTTISITA